MRVRGVDGVFPRELSCIKCSFVRVDSARVKWRDERDDEGRDDATPSRFARLVRSDETRASQSRAEQTLLHSTQRAT